MNYILEYYCDARVTFTTTPLHIKSACSYGPKAHDNPIIGFDQAVLSEEDMKSLPSTLLDLQNAAAHRFHKSLLTPDENGHVRAAEAAIFGSNIYKGSGRMFSCHEIIATSPETFRELLRLRLLINPVMDIVVPNVPVRCACNYVIATAQDAYHLLNCNNVQFLRTRRHTRVKVQVHEHIEKILPKLEYTVEPEFKIGDDFTERRSINPRQIYWSTKNGGFCGF